MSKCISSHGEYSEHEPGDPCPWCGEYDTERIISERDQAEARIKAVRELHSESRIIPGTPVFGCAECGEPNETEPCATIRALDS